MQYCTPPPFAPRLLSPALDPFVMTTRPRILASTIATVLATAIPLLSPTAAQADLNWDAANANNTWVNDGAVLNWLDAGMVPVAWSNNQLAIFAGTGETVTVNSPTT